MAATTPPENGNGVNWHAMSQEAVYESLGTTPEHGLEPDEVESRRLQYGYNELTAAPRPTFAQRLIAQFNDFIVIILIVAAVLSALLGDYVEAAAIIAIVILNAVLGLVQEGRAEAALEALQNLAASVALAIRGGHRVPVPTRELVPADLVVLEAGNNVPADLRLVETVAITAAVLGAYLIGLRGHNEVPLMADTMAHDGFCHAQLLSCCRPFPRDPSASRSFRSVWARTG